MSKMRMNFTHRNAYLKEIKKESQKIIIPEYQRPYRWGVDKCGALWDDIVERFGYNNLLNSNDKVEYFLGSIVSFRNENEDLEIIDGQQRITTFTLLFRAFYENLKKENSGKDDYLDDFGKFIWKKIRNEGFKFDEPFLCSNVIGDGDKEILEQILSENIDMEELKRSKSTYAKNFIFFYDSILKFKQNHSFDFKEFCNDILGEIYFVLLVTCDNEESATTIFNTLNSRGLQLSNADILKGRIYKNLRGDKRRDFAGNWNELVSRYEDEMPDGFSSLFIAFMYVIKAMNNDGSNDRISVVDFFSNEGRSNYGAEEGWIKYEAKIDEMMDFIGILVDFWVSPKDFLSDKAIRYYYVLHSLKNNDWRYFVTFLTWRNRARFGKENFSEEFEKYLPALVKNITSELLNPRLSIRERVFKMNAELNKNNHIEIDSSISLGMDNLLGLNSYKTKYILHLYAFLYDNFESDIVGDFQIEHILPKKWENANFGCWDAESHREYLEQIGNKILLERGLNIECTNGFFAKKQEYYRKSSIKEVLELGKRAKNYWDKEDIEKRNEDIYNTIKNFLTSN